MSDQPDWDKLYELAAAQQGNFSLDQAREAGYSRQLLRHHERHGRLFRQRRGVYRLAHFPPGETEDLVVVWLWSDRQGVFSHQTALMLHELSDVLPSRAHVTVPSEWENRRLRCPPGTVLHYATVPPDQRTWVGSVPVTSPLRTIVDCDEDAVLPDLVEQATSEAIERGFFTRTELEEAMCRRRLERL